MADFASGSPSSVAILLANSKDLPLAGSSKGIFGPRKAGWYLPMTRSATCLFPCPARMPAARYTITSPKYEGMALRRPCSESWL